MSTPRGPILALIGLLVSLSVSFSFSHSAYATFEISIGSNGLVDLGEIMPSSSSGALSSTAPDTVTVNTNCSAGYSIYATSTDDGSTNLVDNTHHTSIVTSSNTIASPGTLANNTWGLVADQTSAINGNFSGLPVYTTDLSSISPIYTAESTASSIRNDSIPIYYGIKVDTGTTPGNYSTNVLYTVLMHDRCLKYTLKFDGNSATTNNLTNQTVTFGDTVDLANFSSADKISRTGYTLSGWKVKIGDSASDTTYATNVSIVPDDGSSSEVTLIAQWAANTYTINYTAGDTGGSCSVSSTSATYDQNVTLSSTKCTKTGYTQDGWSTSNSASNTKTYDMGATLTQPNFTSTNNNTYTLYPHFAANSHTVTINQGTGISSVSGASTYSYGATVNIFASPTSGYKFSSWTVDSGGASLASTTSSSTSFTMPDSDVTITANGELDAVYFQTANSCSTITPGTTGTLTDSRDNQEYTVYRFKDTGTAGNFSNGYPSGMAGYCIMTKNLDLGLVDGTNASGADTTTSQVTARGNMILRPSDSTFDSTYASGSSWTINYVDSANNGAGWSSTNNQSNKQYMFGPQSGYEAYTNHGYYSWGAALTVCPKNWRLPTVSEWNKIATFMGGSNSTSSSRFRSAPYNFNFSGGFYPSGWYYVGTCGVYWSANQYDSTYGQPLYIWSDRLGVDSYFNKYDGTPVRCIAQ